MLPRIEEICPGRDPRRWCSAARRVAAAAAGRLGEAEGICRDLVEADPGHAAAHALWGEVANRRGRRKQAIELYELAIALAPHNEEWLGVYAELCRLTSRPNDALLAARALLNLGERTPQKHMRLGRILFDLGQLEEAAYHLLAATALDPNTTRSRIFSSGRVPIDPRGVSARLDRIRMA